MTHRFAVQMGTATTAVSLFEPICDLYDDVFSQPPFKWADDESTHHRELLTNLRANPSFGIVTALHNELLVGFAYGYTLPIGTKWWTGFISPIPSELSNEHEGRTFALIDLAVYASQRRQGVGRQLMDTLLASRHEDRATLSVQPTATATHAFYRKLGWEKVGTKKMPAGVVSPFFDVYVIGLAENRERPDAHQEPSQQ